LSRLDKAGTHRAIERGLPLPSNTRQTFNCLFANSRDTPGTGASAASADDPGLDNRRAMFLEARHGALLIVTHQAAVARHVGRRDCGKPPVHPIRGHDASVWVRYPAAIRLLALALPTFAHVACKVVRDPIVSGGLLHNQPCPDSDRVRRDHRGGRCSTAISLKATLARHRGIGEWQRDEPFRRPTNRRA